MDKPKQLILLNPISQTKTAPDTATKDYADLTLKSISGANPLKSTIDPVPYTGVQYVDIPEFEQIGDFTSQQLAGALSGSMTTDEAIAASETKIKEIMKEAGYTK